MTHAVATLTASDLCNDASCKAALSHIGLCTCSCKGAGHSSAHRAHFPTQARRTDYVTPGFSRAMVAAMADDAF